MDFNIDDLVKHTQQLTLLYVEDNQESRESTYILLDQLFNKVIVAQDGEDGLEKFKNNEVDFIITDLNMPVMNGITMVDNIKQINPNIPVIVLSAHDEQVYIDKSYNVGANFYLNKPIEMTKLFETIYEIVNYKQS